MKLKIEQGIAAATLFQFLRKELPNNALTNEQNKAESPYNAISCDFV